MPYSCDIIVVSKRIDNLCKTCITEIRKFYPHYRVFFVLDELGEFTVHDSNTVYLVSPGKTIAHKRNLAAEKSDADILAFLDSDAYPHGGWIESAIREFEGNSSIAVVGGPNLFYEKSSKPEYYGFLAQRSILLSTTNNYQPLKSVVRTQHVPASNMIVKRSFYIKLEGMKEDIVTGEDVEFCYRVIKEGGQIVNVPGVCVSHKARGLRGFVRQRFIWGKGVFTVLRYTFPGYLISVFPFLIVGGWLLFILAGCWNLIAWHLLCGTFIMYLALVVFESFRISSSPREFIGVLPYLFWGNIVMGIGSCWGIIFGDKPNAYRYYNNKE